jgi:hypothetical protein
MDSILIERNRAGNFLRHVPNADFDSEGAKHDHEFRVKISDRARLKANGSGFTTTCDDIELVIDEVKLDFEYSLPIWDGRSRKSTGADIEWDLPPMVHVRRQSQTHFAYDLGPHV